MLLSEFENWIRKQIDKGIPNEVIAINFNLYENNEDTFDVQMVGCATFDADDEDWACKSIFSSEEDLFTFASESWEPAEEDFRKLLEVYLNVVGSLLSAYEHIAFGFVDGDLFVVR